MVRGLRVRARALASRLPVGEERSTRVRVAHATRVSSIEAAAESAARARGLDPLSRRGAARRSSARALRFARACSVWTGGL